MIFGNASLSTSNTAQFQAPICNTAGSMELSYYYQLDTYSDNFPLPLLATVKVRKTLQSNIFISVQNFAAALIQTTAACHSQYWSWYMLATTRVRGTIMYSI